MTTYPNNCAFPSDRQDAKGLTKREYFAARIMAGVIANRGVTRLDLAAAYAVRAADTLIAELNK